MSAGVILLFGVLFSFDANFAIFCSLMTLAFAAVRRWFPWGIALGMTVPLTALALFALPQISILSTKIRLRHYALHDVTPIKPILLTGDIRLSLPVPQGYCDRYCDALLKRPAITSVTLNTSDPQMTFAELTAGTDHLAPTARTYRLSPNCRAENPSSRPDGNRLPDHCILAGPPLERYDLLLRWGKVIEQARASGQRYGFSSEWGRPPVPGVRVTYGEARKGNGRLLVRRYAAHADAWASPLKVQGPGMWRPRLDRIWIAAQEVSLPISDFEAQSTERYNLLKHLNADEATE